MMQRHHRCDKIRQRWCGGAIQRSDDAVLGNV